MQKENDEEFDIRAEERRALVILGLLAVFAGLSTALPSTTFINFPANSPFIHITIYVVPFLETLTEYWVVYAVCMYFYFSNDWYRGERWWFKTRQVLHGFGQGFIALYPLSVAYLVVFGEVSFFLPGYAQGVYWFFVIAGLYVVLWSLVEAAFGQKGRLKRLVASWVHSIISLIEEAWSSISEGIEKAWSAISKRRKKRKQNSKES